MWDLPLQTHSFSSFNATKLPAVAEIYIAKVNTFARSVLATFEGPASVTEAYLGVDFTSGAAINISVTSCKQTSYPDCDGGDWETCWPSHGYWDWTVCPCENCSITQSIQRTRPGSLWLSIKSFPVSVAIGAVNYNTATNITQLSLQYRTIP